MLLEEAIQRLQSVYSKGLQSDDSRLTSRHIYSALKTGRSILLRQRSDKNQIVGQWSYQTLPCVELIQAAIHECPCIPTNGCMILRSKYKIPKAVNNMDKHLIQSVTSLDGNIIFDETQFEKVKYGKGNKYTANKPNFYFRNGYLYVNVLKQLKALTLTGLFDDVIEAYSFPSFCPCEDCDCIDIMQLEFPIDGDLIDGLFKIAYQELIILMKQIDEDKTNDASDDGNTGMIHQPQQQNS